MYPINPISGLEFIPFSEFYYQHSAYIDGLLAFLLFWVIANHSLKHNFPESPKLSFVLALAIAIGVVLLEDKTGYSLADFSIVAIYILIVVLLILLGRLFFRPKGQNNIYFGR